MPVEPAKLPDQLQAIGFQFIPEGNWLIKDDAEGQVGGVEHYEWLPSRMRVSLDGTRLELGARKQDLTGLLELAKIIHPTVTGLSTVEHCWDGHSRISTSLDDEWVFIGSPIEPTPMGFQVDYSTVLDAYDLALTSAITGKNVNELRDDEWHGPLINQVENPGGGYTPIFEKAFDNTVHPNSLKPEVKSISNRARELLDVAGYPNVAVWENQVWKRVKGNIEGWDVYTKLEYKREGRVITRHAGTPFLATTGEFTLNLLPPEYLEFRYHADT